MVSGHTTGFDFRREAASLFWWNQVPLTGFPERPDRRQQLAGRRYGPFLSALHAGSATTFFCAGWHVPNLARTEHRRQLLSTQSEFRNRRWGMQRKRKSIRFAR